MSSERLMYVKFTSCVYGVDVWLLNFECASIKILENDAWVLSKISLALWKIFLTLVNSLTSFVMSFVTTWTIADAGLFFGNSCISIASLSFRLKLILILKIKVCWCCLSLSAQNKYFWFYEGVPCLFSSSLFFFSFFIFCL